MKKGFTLIELLAVIIILAVLALIATPAVINVIDEAQDKANRQSANGIVNAGRNYYASSMLDSSKTDKIKNLENVYNDIQIDGNKPDEGEVYVNNKGQVAVSVVIGKKCYVKEFYNELQEKETTEDCNIVFVGNDTNKPTVSLEITGEKGKNDYYVTDTYVNIKAVDEASENESGIAYIKYCTTDSDLQCDLKDSEKIFSDNKDIRILDTNNTKLCAQTYDNMGNSSEVVCTDKIKVDQTAPIAGTINIEGTKGENDWYLSDLIISPIDGTDEMSGHLETTVDIESIKESTEGKVVTITTEDLAGNTSSREHTLKVDKTMPEIEFIKPELDGENGWYISIPTITATVSDTYSDFEKLKWCEGTNCEPTEELTASSKSITVQDISSTQLCIIGIDKAGNNSIKKCSSIIKVDTVKPEFEGIGDLVVAKDSNVDLKDGVTVSDTTSNINGTFKALNAEKIEITTIDTSKAGVIPVTYSVKDNAGNEKTITRKITISTTAPNVTFKAAEGAINENGWAKSDFYVTINVSDNSGHGIKSFNVCTATTDTCNPTNGSVITGSTSATRLISIENSNNRICVQATDNYNQTSEVICSDAYKLDKTVPTAGTITVNGSSTINAWYNKDVTIAAVNGSDALSGHSSTTVNTTSITSNTTGTTVTVTTKDKAGNTSTRNYTIKVDKNQPTCTFSTLSYVGVNKTATIELTCTNTISGMSDNTLTANDFTLSNSNISITSVNKSAVTNGYKYTITVKGITTGSSTITLPAGKVSAVAGLSNTAKTSGNITVTSVSLNVASGTGYVGGSNLTATITSSNAGTLSCSSSNTSIATCSVSGTTLSITPKAIGTSTITVTGSNGSPTTTYTATIKATSISLNSTSSTMYVGGSSKTATISGTNAGTYSCTTSNSNYATCSISGTTLTIKPGSSAGTATITVKESNGNKTATYTATNKATSVSLASTSGIIYVGGSNATTTISGSNYGTLTCTSSNSSYAACSISGTTLTITPKAAGSATITVKEANGNKTATYTATVKTTSVSLASTSGTLYTGGSNKTTTISGSNYGTLTCTTSNSNYATCSISGTTLTIKPGSSVGTATITVKEANGNKTATYTAKVEQGYTCSTGTLTSDSSKGSNSGGYVCVTSGSTGSSCNSCTYQTSAYGQHSSCGYASCSVTSTTSSVGKTTYSCPDGYSASGTITSSTKCSKTVTAKSVGKTTYSCPDGYSASGTITSSTTCSKTTTTSPTTTSATPTKTCPTSGYTLNSSGTTCFRWVGNPSCGSGYSLYGDYSQCKANNAYFGVCTSSTQTGCSSTCPSGYVQVGYSCFAVTSSSCSSGQSMDKYQGEYGCYLYESYETKYSCSSGSLSGTKCYSCPSGYTSSGSGSSMKCSKTETADSVGTTTYTCPSGYSPTGTVSSSTTCSKTETADSVGTTTYTCPSGYSPTGTVSSSTTCSKTETKQDSSCGYASCTYQTSTTGYNCSECGSYTYYYCPSGWSTYSGSDSSLKCYQAASKK